MKSLLKEAIIIDFQPFHTEDRGQIQSFFDGRGYNCNECSFANLFLWQSYFHREWAVEEGILYIRFVRDGRDCFFAPFPEREEDFEKGLSRIRDMFTAEGKPFLLKSVLTPQKEKMEAAAPGAYNFAEDRDMWDYIYRTSDLISLPGKKFRMKKNHLNSFLRQYGDYEYVPIHDETFPAMKEELTAWYDGWEHIEGEEEGIRLLFENWEALGMVGAVIRIYGQIKAFTAGEFLGPEVAHIHFEKADPNIRGLYQAINRDFLIHEFSETTFVNRQEDMGIPGLRQAKMEYNPDHFAEKFDVTLA